MGPFPAQRSVYDIVLQSQRDAIAASTVGATKDQVHQTAIRTLVQGLLNEALSGFGRQYRKRGVQALLHARNRALARMDVHDAGLFADGKPVPYEHGTVTTVEPGLYFDQSEDIGRN